MSSHRHHDPVFSEPTGRRWQRVRFGAVLLGAGSILSMLTLIVVALLPPSLPKTDAFKDKAHIGAPNPRLRDAQRLHERQQMFRSLQRPTRQRGPSTRVAVPARLQARPASDSVLAGFYVNWGDNSFAALEAHIAKLDWVIAEWGFIARHADSLRFTASDSIARATSLASELPTARQPKFLMMLTNVDSGGQFGGAHAGRMLTDSVKRVRMARRLIKAVRDNGLAGVTLDFEELPDNTLPSLERFLRDLRTGFGPGPLITLAIEPSLDTSWVRRYAGLTDRLILMAYDEYSGRGDPGPVASRDWYREQIRRILTAAPPEKIIAGIGAYGYDWNDAGLGMHAAQVTVQEAWDSVRVNRATYGFDTTAISPFIYWTNSDSVDHFIWYLNAVTAYDEIHEARLQGVTGHAIWRLGSEDPSLWRALGRHGALLSPDSLALIDPGYDVVFRGTGELLAIRSIPLFGRRTVLYDSTGHLNGERLDSLPLPWIVERTGQREHEVALTFDDGPDGRWTPMLLDTLRSRGAPATFFIIGQHGMAKPGLLRRIYAEGHEVGNHTFTHPNMTSLPQWRSRLEIDVSARLIEAVLNRRTILFRPPYFGDAEPTTLDELEPIQLATALGYISAGTRVDAQDWRRGISPDSILYHVMSNRWRGNVVLLHDGGGDRLATVAVLGRLIDSLRARGDTIVTLATLTGMSPDAMMPVIPANEQWTRRMELAIFSLVGGGQDAIYVLFFAAIVLGMGRLVFILGLAAIQRFRPRRPIPDYLPTVTVIVPAYNEETVIVATVDSLLAQDYSGPIDIVIVDDGSPDRTHQVAIDAFGDHPRVQIISKPNGGKASALNTGIAEATGEIVICLDADTQFEEETVRYLVGPFSDPHVGAVAGNAKVGNRINLVTRWQALEYITSQNLDRRAFALLDCIMVVPGAVGGWRKSLVLEAGGFSGATLAEDQDLTLAIGRRGHRVAYADHAIAWTEAPDTFRGLAKQRFRWAFGTMQCAWKHRDLFLRPSAGTLGFIALPNVWLFQVGFSAIAPLADLLFVWSLAVITIMANDHGATYTVVSLAHVVQWYAVFLTVDWLAAMLAFFMEPGEDRRLSWLVFIQRFAYRQVMYWVVVRSMVAALRGGLVGWGKLERKATVELRST